MAEEFIRVLSEKTGRVVRERENGYVLLITEIQSRRVIFCFKEGHTGYYYVKIISESDLSSLSCKEAEYSPLGLYAFSKRPAELAKKSYEKAVTLVTKPRHRV